MTPVALRQCLSSATPVRLHIAAHAVYGNMLCAAELADVLASDPQVRTIHARTGHAFGGQWDTARTVRFQMQGLLVADKGRLLAHAYVTSVVDGAVAADRAAEVLAKLLPELSIAAGKDCAVAGDALVAAASGGLVDDAMARELAGAVTSRSPGLSLADLRVAVALAEKVRLPRCYWLLMDGLVGEWM
jgi:hypothetical protein